MKYKYWSEKFREYNFKSTGGYVFETEEKAKAFCDMWNAHIEALQAITDEPAKTRDEYETACKAHNLDPKADSEINAQEYGLTYGEFTPWLIEENGKWKAGGYTPQQVQINTLSTRRLLHMKSQREPAPKQKPDYPDGRKLDCGCIIYFRHEAMNASMGTACESCYDRMS